MPKKNFRNKNQNFYIDYAPAYDYVTKDGANHLRTYLGRVAKGQSEVYTAPFAKGTDIQTVMQEWNKTLVSISDKWPSLYEFESDLAKKVGPQSIMLPLSERYEDVYHYYDDVRTSSTAIEPKAIDKVIDEFAGLRGLRLRSQDKTVDLMKKSTNSGTPYFTKRRNVVPETVPVDVWSYTNKDVRVPWVRQTLNYPDYDQIYLAAAVIGWRGQEGGPSKEDVKQRVVWMFPFGVNIRELQVYQPLIEGAQKLNLVPAWVSMDEVDKKVTALFDTKAKDDLVVCTDFSRFDQHFNEDMQHCAYTVLDSILAQDSESASWLTQIFRVKYTIPMILADDKLGIKTINGHHGMASGSGGTNVDETLVHRALQYEAAILNGSELNPNSQCLGDDGILTYPGITVEDVVAAYESHGQECNLDKQYAASQDCIYLRRWHHNDYRIDRICAGVYSTMRAIGRLRYLERYMDPEFWSPELVALRQLSIIENCNKHPLREEFAEFCMKRDKYRLGIDIPGFLDQIESKALEAIDHMPDFLGYTKTLQGQGPRGISNWWIVRYLKSHG